MPAPTSNCRLSSSANQALFSSSKLLILRLTPTEQRTLTILKSNPCAKSATMHSSKFLAVGFDRLEYLWWEEQSDHRPYMTDSATNSSFFQYSRFVGRRRDGFGKGDGWRTPLVCRPHSKYCCQASFHASLTQPTYLHSI